MARRPSEPDITITIEIDATVEQMQQQFERLVHDAYNSRSAQSQIELIDGVADQWQWVALLDGDVCPECEDLDGELFEVGDDEPPLHPRCRCNVSAVINTDDLKDAIG